MKSLKSILTVLLFLSFMTAQKNQEIKLLDVTVEGNAVLDTFGVKRK